MAEKNQNKNQMVQTSSPFFPMFNMFDRSLDWPMLSAVNWPMLPNKLSALSGITLYEDDKNIVIEAPVPGLTNKDVKVTFDEGCLHISGNKKQEVSKNEANRTYYNQSRTSFNYDFPVPRNVDERKEPKVQVADGMMKVIFTKLRKKDAKTIQVK